MRASQLHYAQPKFHLQKANKKDTAEEIEEERAKVEARTPITQEVFKMWRGNKVRARLLHFEFAVGRLLELTHASFATF